MLAIIYQNSELTLSRLSSAPLQPQPWEENPCLQLAAALTSHLHPEPRIQETLKYVLKSTILQDSTDLIPVRLKSKHEVTGFPEHAYFTEPGFQTFIILS